jgi:hypothetical protein
MWLLKSFHSYLHVLPLFLSYSSPVFLFVSSVSISPRSFNPLLHVKQFTHLRSSLPLSLSYIYLLPWLVQYFFRVRFICSSSRHFFHRILAVVEDVSDCPSESTQSVTETDCHFTQCHNPGVHSRMCRGNKSLHTTWRTWNSKIKKVQWFLQSMINFIVQILEKSVIRNSRCKTVPVTGREDP